MTKHSLREVNECWCQRGPVRLRHLEIFEVFLEKAAFELGVVSGYEAQAAILGPLQVQRLLCINHRSRQEPYPPLSKYSPSFLFHPWAGACVYWRACGHRPRQSCGPPSVTKSIFWRSRPWMWASLSAVLTHLGLLFSLNAHSTRNPHWPLTQGKSTASGAHLHIHHLDMLCPRPYKTGWGHHWVQQPRSSLWGCLCPKR